MFQIRLNSIIYSAFCVFSQHYSLNWIITVNMKQVGLLPNPGKLLGPIERWKIAGDPWKVVRGLERNVPGLYADLSGGPITLE